MNKKYETIFIICMLLVFFSSSGLAISGSKQQNEQQQNNTSIQQDDWFLAVIGIIGAVASVAALVITVWPDRPVAEATVQITVDGDVRNPVIDRAYDPDRIAYARDSAIGRLGSQAVGDLTVTNPVGFACTTDTDNSYGRPAKHGSARVVFTARCDGQIRVVPPIGVPETTVLQPVELAEVTATVLNFSSFNFNMSKTALPGDSFKMDTRFVVENQSIFEWGFTAKIDTTNNLYIAERRGNFSDGDIDIDSTNRLITGIRNQTVNFSIPFNQTTNISSDAAFDVQESMAAPPPVDQSMSIYDTTVTQLVEQNCRNCHTSGVPDRHHNLVPTGEYNCNNCHPIITNINGQSVLLDRNCVACHNGSAFYANPNLRAGRPHHNTTLAQIRNCKQCHGGFVDDYNDGHYIPTYSPSLVTPDTSYKIINSTTGKKWGGCEACHEEYLNATPDILSNVDNHHNEIVNVTSGNTCNWCHTDSGGGLNIRKCEDCHSVSTVHNIQYNYNQTNGKLGYGHIGNNWDCNGCHAWYDAGITYPSGAIIPDIFSINPSKLTSGIPTAVTIDGINFVNDQYTSIVSVDGIRLVPSSITDNQIVVTIPALSSGVRTIQVIKTGDVIDKPSRLSTLTVVDPVDITSAKITKRVKNPPLVEITILGTGFGPKPEPLTDPLYNEHGVWVTTKKGITTKADIVNWTATTIVANVDSANVRDSINVKALYGQDNATIGG